MTIRHLLGRRPSALGPRPSEATTHSIPRPEGRLLALAALTVAATLTAQTTTPPPAQPPVLSDTAGAAYERRDSLPTVNVYLPEGRASLRLRKLIKNVLFETQFEYEFINGDISTFLRYKYYARNYFYRIGVFDSIEFPNVGEQSTTEFERVRGGLLLMGFPRDYDERYFWLVQDDRLTFGDLAEVDNKKNNVYTKIGYQFGTQFDERMNAIVGETRGRITPVLTAFRDIGPQRTGLAAALTESARFGCKEVTDEATGNIGRNCTADYRYTKLEAEALRRFDITPTSFIFSRVHVGAFAGYDEPEERKNRPQVERYSVPRYEMFSLAGREALKGVDSNEQAQGTHEFHVTGEYFRPIFRNRDLKTGPLHWNTMYGIAYLGTGTVGFDYDQIVKTKDYVVDGGLGFEAAITIRDFDVLLSFLYARTLKAPSPGCPEATVGEDGCRDLEGSNYIISLRTIR